MARILLAVVICLVSCSCCYARHYIGCYEDKTSRYWPNMIASGADMTVDKCAQLCGYEHRYAGVQYGGQCFCGNHLRYDYAKYPDSACSTACKGDSSQKCGATWKMSIYSTNKYEGCYQDNSTRLVGTSPMTSNSMTTEMCINHCRGQNAVFAATENRKQCFCGNSLRDYEKKPLSDCNHECKGATSEYCGGFWRASLYLLV